MTDLFLTTLVILPRSVKFLSLARNMEVIMLALLVVPIVSGDSRNECDNPQFVELGKPATLNCIFDSGFVGLFWYNSTNIDDDTPLVFFQWQNSGKSGKGFDSGEYDIHRNGSLIITNVTVMHETMFTVSQLINLQGLERLHYINVKTYVEPKQQFPLIQECDEKHHCYLSYTKVSSLSCCVNNSRPNISLLWTDRLTEDENNITTIQSVGTNGMTFSSCAITNYPSQQLHRLSLLICSAADPLMLLTKDRSFVVVENENIATEQVDTSTLYLEVDSTINLTCSEFQSSVFLWRTSQNNRILAYGISQKDFNFSRSYDDFVEVGSKGNLYIQRIKPQHEGIYLCYHRTIKKEGTFSYEVTTYVKPRPAYPLIEGCDQQYCVLLDQRQDQLRCTLYGIRPITHLEFVSLMENQQHVILNQTHKVTTRGDVSDISVIAKLSPSEQGQVTLVCRTTGPNSDLWKLETVVDLRYSQVNHDEKEDQRAHFWIPLVMTGLIFAAVFIILLILLIRRVSTCRDRPKERREVKGPENEKLMEMTPSDTGSGHTHIPENEQKFIKCLKSTYGTMCGKVYPIPYMTGQPHRVEDVFVEVGIELLERDQSTQSSCSKKVRLSSYHDMFDPNVVNSSRVILMADPGHGKSTLFLQYALDWIKRRQSSPLKDIKVLILLQLRNMTKADTIYRAIRTQLLPKNEQFSDKDIMDILNTCSESSVIILDGFDEYSDRMVHSETIDIINGKLFPEVKVIISTRASCIPDDLDATVVKLRLIGFDEIAHNRYIDNVIQSDKVKTRLKAILKMNPILEDLYRIPLLCVMFIHMVQKETDVSRFYSVTNFFKAMLTGFFHHKWNKDGKTQKLNSAKLEFPRYPGLNELCFHALCGRTESWTYKDILSKIGKDCYKELTDIGILIEEKSLSNNYKTDDPPQYVTEIKFFHRLFVEWYAANHVEEHGNKALKNTFKKYQLVQKQLFLRFCCGLSSKNAEIIKKYIADADKGQLFHMFCDLEQSRDKPEEFLLKVEKLCSGHMVLASSDTHLHQSSALQLLEIASNNTDISLNVRLENSFKEVDQMTGTIILKSDLRMTSLKTLQTLQINGDNSTVDTNSFLGILEYCSKCSSLRKVTFSDYIVPKLVEVGLTISNLRQRKDLSVEWKTFFMLSLDLTSGRWQDLRTNKELRDRDHENWVLYTRNKLTEEELKRQWNHGR